MFCFLINHVYRVINYYSVLIDQLIYRVPSINNQRMSLNKRRLVRAQKQDSISNLLGCPHPAHWGNIYRWPQAFSNLLRPGCEGCLNDSRTHAIDPDIIARVVDSVAAGQVDYGGFRSTVGRYMCPC